MENSTQHLSNRSSPPTPTIATRLYVPGWWVRAWEQALHKQQLLEASLTPGLDSVLMPSLDIGSLNLIAVLCAELQQQILAEEWSPREPLKLHWNEVKKLICSSDTGSIAKLSTALEQLGGLRLNLQQDFHHSNGGVVPLFLTERWTKNTDDPNDTVLTLVPNEQTLELLIGYCDGHIDLLRKANGQPRVADVLASSAPLVLWKPVWLELALAEQAVYLRLEKSMQWDMTWLQLDGVFCATVDELFSDVRLAKRASATASVLMERLRVCGRLGRKLVSHGVIAREPQSNFFAVSSESEGSPSAPGPSLIWQASSERLLSHEENAHFGRAAQAMLAHLIGPAMPQILKMLSAGTDFATGTRHTELQIIAEQLKKVPSGAIRIGSAVLIQVQVLFLEWSLRKMTGSQFPLPQELLKQDILQLCCLDSRSPELFARFCERALSTPEVSRIFSEIPHASLANLPKAEFEGILPRLRSALRTVTNQTTTVPTTKAPAIQAANSNLLPTTQTDLSAKPAPTIDVAQSALLRIAREELEKMMKADHHSFSALKNSYLKSLDEPQRQLMCDVERRMKPQLFDQQLKQRLVRFMVEHPSTWKSTSQILQ